MNRSLNHLLNRVQALRTPADGGRVSDRELLERFVARREEAAFTALVHRHGSLVMGVCWRILRNPHDVDDAWQATFLILVRKAATIRKQASVSSWLHGVALRVAQKLKRQGFKRPMRSKHDESVAADPVVDEISWQEVSQLLDEELQRLPDRFRLPLMLCYLEGKTHNEAAAQLGWRLTTLRGRLGLGRRMLQARLSTRGISFSTAITAAMLVPESVNAVSSRLIHSTVQAAMNSSQAAAMSTKVHSLVEGVIRTMFLRKLSVTAMVAGLALSLFVGGLAYVGSDAPQAAAAQTAVAEHSLAANSKEKQPRSRTRMADNDVPAPNAKDKPAAPKTKDADQEFAAKIKESREKAILWLKNAQQADGSWAEKQPNQVEGMSALAVLALLESGVKITDPVVIKGLKYLRQIEPKQTYAVSLQTMAFCLANDRQDLNRVRRNVEWLEKAAARPNNQLAGWSYIESAERGDGSNTQFAIMALYRASQVGVKPKDKDFWNQVRQMYFISQQNDGGWLYSGTVGASSHSMTIGGLCGLHICNLALDKSTKESEKAIENGFAWMKRNFSFEHSFALYNLYGIGRLGKLSEKKTFDVADKKLDWNREGTEWLLKKQKADGAFVADEKCLGGMPIVATSFGLLFLAMDR